MRQLLTQFVVCVAVLLLLATPLFYWLTKSFYAEDMIDVIAFARQGRDIPALDLERDIMQGVMLQFVLIAGILGIALVLTMRFIAHRLWRPFDRTLRAIEAFNLEAGTCPGLDDSDVREFHRLNTALTKMMGDSLQSYKLQKEFTENASHELQTPLAVFRSRLDLLLQQPDITERQAAIIQDLYRMNGRLSRLSRNLLLLAKMENRQFETVEQIDVIGLLNEQMPYLESLAEGLAVVKDYRVAALTVRANRALLESLVNNLVVNAVRHNRPGGEIGVTVTAAGLAVANTSDGPALDAAHVFSRFYRPASCGKGNGLGLAIVKAVCDYHHWSVAYSHADGVHSFEVTFG